MSKNTRKIYEITNDFMAIQELLEDEETEFKEALENTLEGIEYEFEEKIINLAKVIKNMEIQNGALKGTEKALEDELKRVKDKIRARENKLKEIKEYMLNNMNLVGKQNIKTNEFSVYKSRTVVCKILDTRKAQNSEYVRIIKEVDKAAILKALRENNNIDFATAEEKEYIVIR